MTIYRCARSGRNNIIWWRSALLAKGYSLHAQVCTYFGAISDPCCIREPIVNHNELFKENLFSKTSGASELQGCGFSHSYGLNLNTENMQIHYKSLLLLYGYNIWELSRVVNATGCKYVLNDNITGLSGFWVVVVVVESKYGLRSGLLKYNNNVYSFASIFHGPFLLRTVVFFLTWEVCRSPVAWEIQTRTTYSSWGRTDFPDCLGLGYTDGDCTIRTAWILMCTAKTMFVVILFVFFIFKIL